jgi:murein DD-endopeptidase MepM/ murein hydrolase activator NlpD
MSRTLVAVGAVSGLALIAAASIPVIMMTTMIAGSSGSNASAGGEFGRSACALETSSATVADLDGEQVSNARVLIRVGKSLHIPPHGWVVAISVALQESGLRNLDYGDRDSLGTMQQRPSEGWGSPTQIQDPTYAARAFYGGPRSPTANSGLLSVKGWADMPVWEAAQTVQRSAFPMAYEKHEALATELVQRLSGEPTRCQNLAAGPWQLPVQTSYTLTSSYGPRVSPTTGGADFHTGQDFAAPEGTPALAASQGEVVFTGWNGGYGNLVRISHSNGVETWYGHLSRIDVHVGDAVRKGDAVGAVGSTGNSTGPHLHLEVRVDDKPADPMPWLRQKGLTP